MSKNSQSEAVLHCQKLFTFFIGFFVLLATVCSFADEEIEDLIDIFESDGKVIAVLEGKKSVPFNLLPKEKVLWSDSKGYLGAFLTNWVCTLLNCPLDLTYGYGRAKAPRFRY